MPMMATAGLTPRATVDAPLGKNDGDCAFCSASADGFDAGFGAPVCRDCATGGGE